MPETFRGDFWSEYPENDKLAKTIEDYGQDLWAQVTQDPEPAKVREAAREAREMLESMIAGNDARGIDRGLSAELDPKQQKALLDYIDYRLEQWESGVL